MAITSPRGTDAKAGGRDFRQRTLWRRGLTAPVRDFLTDETGGAAMLLGAGLAALIWANSPWPHSYEAVWRTMFSIRIGDAGISQDLRHWVNEGLMTLYFLVLGLEARRELAMGQLRERRRAAVPIAAALGGMALPVALYLAFNAGGPGRGGWAAAMSTDTAFALGLLALVAPASARLRVRLLTLTVFDDLVALAEAAGARGAFWPMHDKLFSHQDELLLSDLRRYAAELGLDADRFSDELAGRVYQSRVEADIASADASGVAGTPSFFVNGKRHDGAYDTGTLGAAVRAARTRAVAVRRHA